MTNQETSILKKLSKQIASILKMEYINGDVYLTIDVKCNNYKELDDICNSVLSNVIAPDGSQKTDNIVNAKRVTIIISFVKI